MINSENVNTTNPEIRIKLKKCSILVLGNSGKSVQGDDILK